jgi:hypothetical protein
MAPRLLLSIRHGPRTALERGRNQERHMIAARATNVIEIIRREYQEMPDLRLTPAQAARLWHLEAALARAILDGLVQSGFLRVTPEGRYGRISAY